MSDRAKDTLIDILIFAVCIVFGVLLCGCTAFYQNAGSRTRVGNVSAPIEFSDATDSMVVRALYSLDGADVYTAKDMRVRVEYRNVTTNSYFGIISEHINQNLTVELDPTVSTTEESSPVVAD